MKMRKGLRIGLILMLVVMLGLTMRIANVLPHSYAGVGTEYLDYLPQIDREPTSTLTPTVTATLPPLPDLAYYYYQVTYYGCPWGSPGNILVRVRNTGEVDAGHFAVDINSLRTTVEGVEAGGFRDPSVEFSQGPVGGMEIVVDSENEVWESNEANNFFRVMFTPPPPCEMPEP